MNAETKRRLTDVIGSGVALGAGGLIGAGRPYVEKVAARQATVTPSTGAERALKMVYAENGIPLSAASMVFAHVLWRPVYEPLGLSMLGAAGAGIARSLFQKAHRGQPVKELGDP